MIMQYTTTYQSPLGSITLASNGESLTGLWFAGQKYYGETLSAEHEEKDLSVFSQTRSWLDCYFRGEDPHLHLRCICTAPHSDLKYGRS